jgi:uncharacterized membrane protein YfcA
MAIGSDTIVLVLISLLAAVVNGALGYGFSSITVPVALFFYTNRILNPALVLVEVVVNCYTLIMNRSSLPSVWKRVFPMLLGLFPGILLGSFLLSEVNPGWIKLFTYTFLLPLILLQAAGFRRPIRSERAMGLPFGTFIGFLYSVTTVSGPPLAMMFSNQGFVKQEFRAALGMIRVAESSMTAATYFSLGFYTLQSGHILYAIIPSVLLGIPLGTFLIGRINPETFRRICMSFDVWVVGFGLSKVLGDLKLINPVMAFGVLLGAVLIDLVLLYNFFKKAKPKLESTQGLEFSKSLIEKER